MIMAMNEEILKERRKEQMLYRRYQVSQACGEGNSRIVECLCSLLAAIADTLRNSQFSRYRKYADNQFLYR
jgi:hypothetical protein